MNCKWIGLIVFAFLISSCVYHDIPEKIDCKASGLSIKVIDSVKALRCDVSDGAFTVEATGGKPPYFFAIEGGIEQESPVFSGLASGLYKVYVRDKNNCTAKREKILISVLNFDVDFEFTADSVCLSPSGTMAINVNETNGPYQFDLDESGVYTLSPVFEGMKHGDHFLSIQDTDGCNIEMKVTVPRGFTAVSWVDEILPIMTESCAKVGCHDGISRPNDWRIYAQVKQNSAAIRFRTQNKNMPFDTTLPQDEIDLIACWIDDGALEN